MARYIDADALREKLRRMPIFEKTEKDKGLFYVEWSCIESMPSADVVPRAEVERLTIELEAMRMAANSYKMHYENLAREIFEEIERAKLHIGSEIKVFKAISVGEIDEPENRHVQCGELDHSTEKGGEF